LYSYMKIEDETSWNFSEMGEEWRGRMVEGINLIKIFYKHTCKYCNVSSSTTVIVNKSILKRKIILFPWEHFHLPVSVPSSLKYWYYRKSRCLIPWTLELHTYKERIGGLIFFPS
jgi:hypothetical protein